MNCGLAGQNIKYSFSRDVHSHFGIDDYRIYDVNPAQFDKLIKSGGLTGLNVTVPYKKYALRYCDELSDEARGCGCVNTLIFAEGKIKGYNTDCLGMAYSMKKAGISLHGKKILIFGSGATSHTAGYVCRKQHAARVTVISRRGKNNYHNMSRHDDTDIIINTTPLGMGKYAFVSPADISQFPRLSGVVEVAYNPIFSALAVEAKKRDIPCAAGLEMLIGQAAASAAIFGGLRADETYVDKICDDFIHNTLNIVLIGMPGCGKTTIGRRLAKQTGRAFIDTDETINREYGMRPAEIITQNGEKFFREIESNVLKELAQTKHSVIATGGGVIEREENYLYLKSNSFIVSLEKRPERLSLRNRPLSTDIYALYRRRKPKYSAFADKRIRNEANKDAVCRRITEAFYEYTGH